MSAPAGPTTIDVHGARVHNLKDVDVSVPLGQMVAVAGVSGSGKSSLALGVLYAEGARRYLESLSTYTRRRLTQAARPDVDEVEHVPAALALHQRPPVPGVRSTFGTSTEVLNSLRLAYSRLGHHQCPNGHLNEPTIDVALDVPLHCSTCGVEFPQPGAESFAFNSDGACPTCEGTGEVREVDEDSLVPDESLTIREGAVRSWGIFGIGWMWNVAEALGVRVDVPFRELTDDEHETVLHGESVKRLVTIPSKTGKLFELNATYRNAVAAVTEAMSGANSEKGLERLGRFMTVRTCPDCHGSRLSALVRSTKVRGIGLDEACTMPLADLLDWAAGIPATMPGELVAMAHQIVDELTVTARRLMDLGLGYLSLDRASSTLSTGERQRVQLARAVRNRTTGVLYVLDEPSIGLHPANVEGLLGVMRDLIADGNSVLVVDHDAELLAQADWLLEIGPGSGEAGGTVVVNAPVADAVADPSSLIVPFITGAADIVVREQPEAEEVFERGTIHLETAPIHTVRALDVEVPEQRLTAVTGVSGSGKTTLVLEALVPALKSLADDGAPLPAPATSLETDGADRVVVVDATPIGANVRSTVATYSGVMDNLRRVYASLPEAKAAGLKAGDFSYNTGSLRCEHCDGTGQVVLDVQFLPDVEIECPVCEGTRYGEAARAIRRVPRGADDEAGHSLPELLGLTAAEALEACDDLPKVRKQLRLLMDLGLDYLTLGEATTALSGGEAQRLKLSTDLGRDRHGAVFVLDEPSIGLHPLDVRVLLGVLDRLFDAGATVLVIEHDLDMIANADWVLDMGPGGGEAGGRVIAAGTPEQLADGSAALGPDESLTGRYLAAHLSRNPAR
ncbi:excinuclease ABC subunit UvrA [Actinomyces radicidentis]|uniref:excinuclease ABC subunit UvrA n=1 Tax=Actinomyces radicidentis TaxID=111015 RepID=UPI0026DEFBDE|nr:excinuclease ABC subunit UvrA [Actinomyces radicidentis]